MKFQRGISGNPAGRPAGSGFVGEQRKRLQSKLPEVVDALIAGALAGEVTSLKLYLERVMPALKPETKSVHIDLSGTLGLADIGNRVIESIAAGNMSPETGAQFLSALSNQAKLVEVTDLEQRVAALEQTNGNQS